MLTPSCNFDQLEPRTTPEICDTLITSYITNIQAVVETNCAYIGCHIAGFTSGDFSTYDGMLPFLENGKFALRSLELQDMPPSNSTGPTELSPEDFDLLTCWIANDFPEN